MRVEYIKYTGGCQKRCSRSGPCVILSEAKDLVLDSSGFALRMTCWARTVTKRFTKMRLSLRGNMG